MCLTCSHLHGSIYLKVPFKKQLRHYSIAYYILVDSQNQVVSNTPENKKACGENTEQQKCSVQVRNPKILCTCGSYICRQGTSRRLTTCLAMKDPKDAVYVLGCFGRLNICE